jgi:hypothetical protein
MSSCTSQCGVSCCNHPTRSFLHRRRLLMVSGVRTSPMPPRTLCSFIHKLERTSNWGGGAEPVNSAFFFRAARQVSLRLTPHRLTARLRDFRKHPPSALRNRASNGSSQPRSMPCPKASDQHRSPPPTNNQELLSPSHLTHQKNTTARKGNQRIKVEMPMLGEKSGTEIDSGFQSWPLVCKNSHRKPALKRPTLPTVHHTPLDRCQVRDHACALDFGNSEEQNVF